MRVSRLERQRGMSLIELLVIVMIIGLVAMVTFGEASKTYRKWRLEGAVSEAQTFLDSLTRRAQENHQRLFARLEGHTLTACLSSDGTGVVATLTIPDYIAFHATNPTGLDTTWPSVSPARELACDPRGITLDPTTGQMVAAEQRLTMTHIDMAAGNLTPRIVYSVRISPLWRCYTARSLQ
jgi:prepilin-type N-terminal cleavage/methylation domain-containing protein